MAKALKNWKKITLETSRSNWPVIKEVVWQLDQAQERRSQAEISFREIIKEVYLGLLAIDKVRARQRSRLVNIKHAMQTQSSSILGQMVGKERSTYMSCKPPKASLSRMRTKREIARHFGDLLGKKHSRTIALKLGRAGLPDL
jgi:hypothetical protein